MITLSLRLLPLAVSFVCVACSTTPASAPATSTDSAAPATTSASSAAASADDVSARAQAIVDAADRSADDRALDAGRKPAALLAFIDVKPGMRVAELAAGGGYTTELLARAVGPTGKVYGQNNKFVLERFAEKPWSERLKKPVLANVVRVDREFDDPLPADVNELDVVVMNLFYHDTVWQKTDRAAMNKNILRALKPGGRFIVVDHSARAGAGVTEAQTLHRIEESVVKDELRAAGFELVRDGDFLRNASDPRDWNASPREAGERRGESDRFVIEARRPTT